MNKTSFKEGLIFLFEFGYFFLLHFTPLPCLLSFGNLLWKAIALAEAVQHLQGDFSFSALQILN